METKGHGGRRADRMLACMVGPCDGAGLADTRGRGSPGGVADTLAIPSGAAEVAGLRMFPSSSVGADVTSRMAARWCPLLQVKPTAPSPASWRA